MKRIKRVNKRNSFERKLFLNFFSKKGISAIIATVLIVMLTITSFTVVWVSIVPMVQNLINSGAADCLDTDISVVSPSDFTCKDTTDSAGNKIHIQLSRGTNEMDISKIRFIFEKSGVTTTDTEEKSGTDVLAKGSEQTYDFDSIIEFPDKVNIAFVLKDNKGIEKQCDVSSYIDITTLPECTSEIKTTFRNLGGAGKIVIGKVINGQCGNAFRNSYYNKPDVDLCYEDLSLDDPNVQLNFERTKWTWSCTGTKTSEDCWANKINLGNIYFKDSAGNTITSAKVGDTVKIILENGASIVNPKFEIYEDDGLLPVNNIKTITQNNALVPVVEVDNLVATWTITNADWTAGYGSLEGSELEFYAQYASDKKTAILLTTKPVVVDPCVGKADGYQDASFSSYDAVAPGYLYCYSQKLSSCGWYLTTGSTPGNGDFTGLATGCTPSLIGQIYWGSEATAAQYGTDSTGRQGFYGGASPGYKIVAGSPVVIREQRCNCVPILDSSKKTLGATCTTSTDCFSGVCTGGVCSQPVTTKALGATCSASTDCVSGFCADGVCCENACGTCKACNLPGNLGKCKNVERDKQTTGCTGSDSSGTYSNYCDGCGNCRKVGWTYTGVYDANHW
ncbi:MAG: hypothetical protein Q7S33_01760, partial [Nanoarchaeota archaeon]|nr:hypothetical protein [Nanoarchaeota archaeon]